ncbi:MAG TPA: dihydrolipoyl dehydrogenase [Tepidiformaceae bacterium]
MTESQAELRVVVIGAGPGGYPAAFLAAHKGAKVTLIDEAPEPGGVCLFRGCIPSKTLLHVASLMGEAEHAAEWGIRYEKPEIELDKLRDWKNKVIGRMARGLTGLAKQRKVRWVQGRARFGDAQHVLVKGKNGEERIDFDFAIVATGSRPTRPRGMDADSPRIMDSTAALELADIPETLLVVGGGYIGLELGSVYARLGSKVTVVELTTGLLPGADRDLIEPLARRLKEQFASILLNTKVTGLEVFDRGVNVQLVGPDVSAPDRLFEKVLVAVGRRPNTENLGLEQTRVELDDRGFIRTDIQRRTGEPSIFAIGDVAGEPMLAHKATHEARAAVEAIFGEPSAFDQRAIPAVVFTDPEIAWCGLTETEALNRGIPFEVAKFPWSALGRATTLGRNEGLTKLLLQPMTHRVLGVGIVGVGAGDLISEAALAIEMGAVADDLKHTIHPHPTLSEGIMEAAEVLYGQSPHYVARSR